MIVLPPRYSPWPDDGPPTTDHRPPAAVIGDTTQALTASACAYTAAPRQDGHADALNGHTGQPFRHSEPPLDTALLDLLLARHPAVAARVLIAMPHRRRWAQLCAYATLLDVPTTRLQREWADLFTCAAQPDAVPRVCAPLDPVDCALLDPVDLAAALRAMTPAQRMAQAVAQAAWLSSFGFPVNAHEILAGWELPAVVQHAG